MVMIDQRGLLVLAVILAVAVATHAQDCQCEKLQSRITEIEEQLATKMGAVRLHRREDLEDQVFSPKLGSTDIETPILIYQVEGRQYHLSRGEVVQTVPVGKYSSYIVISRDARKVYRLGGFDGSEENFNQLVKDQPLPILPTKSNAESRALLCTEVVYGIPRDLWIFDESNVKLDLAHHFFDLAKDNGFQRSDSWWKNYRAAHPQFKAGATVIQEERNFLVGLPYFWAPLEGDRVPEIRELKVEVRPDGTCHRH
jgi:hypothetical protein